MHDFQLSCPVCQVPLTRTDGGIGILWTCPRCDGRAVTLALLRRGIAHEFMNHLWHTARTNAGKNRLGQHQCPSCNKRMSYAEMPIATESDSETEKIAPSAEPNESDQPLVLDLCPLCQFIWLDPGETARLPAKPTSPVNKTSELSPAAKEAIALAEVEALGRRAETDYEPHPILDSLPEIILRELLRKFLHW